MNVQLSLFETSSTLSSNVELAADSTLSSNVEQQIEALLQFCTRKKDELSGCVSTYHPGSKNHKYYRFTYCVGRRQKQKHIPGGCVGSPIAEKRAAIIREMCRANKSTLEILDLIGAF